MTAPELLMIVPTRSRPESIARVVEAWHETGAFDDGAELLFAIDEDDPRHAEYVAAIEPTYAVAAELPAWKPLVPKLNEVARAYVDYRFAIGFAGDDHLPRTRGWARAYLDALHGLRSGVVSCPDGYRPDALPTQWAMTSDIVRELDAMVPAPVEHLFCDNVVWDLAVEAGGYVYLDHHLIEHMHPVAGKADRDEQYDRVNARPQWRTDRAIYREWRRHDLWRHAAQIRALRENGAKA